MVCEICGGDHSETVCDQLDDKTPPIILHSEIEQQLQHQIIEAAVEWYGQTCDYPYHPPPVGRHWKALIYRLAQLRDVRRKYD